MVDLSEDGKRLIAQLFSQTGGDTAATESMFDIGEAAGLSREQSGTAAEELIGWGLVEVRTLSGGIALAKDGVTEAGRIIGSDNGTDPTAFRLGADPVIDKTGQAAVDRLVLRLKSEAEHLGLGFERLSEMIADLKTIDAQITSPRPKTGVVREALRSILYVLSAGGAGSVETEVRRILGE